MRTKKLFSMKKAMRAMALSLATVLVVGSLNVMEVSAEDPGIIYPKYNQETGKYTFNEKDVFGAATHVHLFGNEVTTSAHTHGNVMANIANLDEIGMRDGKVAYPSEYIEYSYVGDWVDFPSVTIWDPVIIGKDMKYDKASGQAQGTVTNYNNTEESALTVYDGIYWKAGVDAVDIQGTLDDLKDLSKEWATAVKTAELNGTTVQTGTFDLTSNENNRIIDAAQAGRENENVYIDIPFADWEATSNYIQIKGIDSNVNNNGYVIINIDLKGQTDVDLSCGDMKVYDTKGNTYSNTEHSSAAFGGCRIVYNLFDSTEADYAFKGNITFTGTAFGNILAPGATVTMGALNGNVMADKIFHINQESHRLDIVPIFSKADGSAATDKVEKDEIRLLLKLEGTPDKTDFYNDPAVKDDEEPIESTTQYTLYKDATGNTPVYTANTSAEEQKLYDQFNEIDAVWNEDAGTYEMIIGSEYVTSQLEPGEYWLIKGDITEGYQDNNDIFRVIIATDGTVSYAKNDSTDTQTEVMTDVLKKAPTPVTIEDLILNLDLDGDTENYAADVESGTSYKVYSDESCTMEVTELGTISATWNDTDKTFQVVIDGDKLTIGETYYLKKVEPVTTGYDSNTNKYEAIVGTDGNITYRETTGTNAFTGESKEGPVEDVLTKTTVVVDVEDLVLNLDLIGDDTTGYTAGKESGTSYKVYSDESCTTEVTELGTIPATWNDTDKTFQVVIDGDKLTAGETYYLKKVEPVTEGYDTNTNKYEAKVDENSGNITYRETNTNTFSGTYAEGPLKDELNKTPVVVQPNDEIVINVVFSGPNAGEPTDTDGSTVKYQIYKEPACDPADAISGLEATITKDASGNWKVVFDAEDTEDLAKDTDYYITVSNNGSGFKDEKTEPYKVKFNPQTGATQYGVAGGYVATSPTDKLIKNEGIELEVEFTGEPFTGTNSDVTYDIYDEAGNKVTTTPIEANDSNNDDLFEVTVDSSYTTENLDRDKLYYIGISGNESGYTDKSKDQYWVKFDENGKVSYSTDKNASDDKWSDTPLKDTLVKTPAGANDKIEINVEFSGPEGTSPSANSGVKYELLEKDASGNLVPVKDANGNDVVKEAIKDGAGWKVEFGLDVTEDLDKDKDYFVKVSDNGSDYKDKSEDTYKVKFDSQTGETKYYDETVNDYVTTPPTDQLFKNDKIELDVELEGETAPAGGTGSNVKYDIFTDPEKENVVPNTNSQEAIFNDQKGKYEIIIDSDITNELDRSDLSDGNSANDKIYYIGISNNSSGYTDKEEESFMVKIDQNGDAWYSKDGNSWQKNPMVDVLEKNDPAGGNTNTGGTPGTVDPGNGGNSGNSNANNNTTTNKTNTTVTDGANNNSLTGGNNITSAKTGEVNTALIFGGFVAVLAAAAGVYVFIKRKRA